MIEEIFVVGNDDEVLYGDVSRFPRGLVYPVHETEDLKVVQVAVGDIRIAVLYDMIDKFSALRYIEGLLTRLERRLKVVNRRKILENYFLLFELLNRKESVIIEQGRKGLIPAMSSSNMYIDVVEYSNFVMDGNKVVLNRTTGCCSLNGSFDDERTIRLVVTRPTTSSKVVYKSSGRVAEELNEVRVEVKTRNPRAEIFRYWIQEEVGTLVEIQKESEGYVMSCREQTEFDHLEVCFPVPRMASKVVRVHSAGRSVYDENSNVLRWVFANEVVKRERISYRVELFEECEDTRPITVRFSAKKTQGTSVRIEKAECTDNQSVVFWIRYSVCSGRCEIRI